MSNVHVVIDKGTAPKSVLIEGLNDVLQDGDILALPWYGIKPTPDGLAEVYGYVLDNEVEFIMYHASGSTPPRAILNSGHGAIQEVGNVNTALMNAVGGKGKVLFLWDSTDDEGSSSLAERVIATVSEKTKVVELTNGLAPIVFTADIPDPPAAEGEEYLPPDDAPKPFTRDELEGMPVASLKKLAKNNGLPDGVTGKANYIKQILGEPLLDMAFPPGKEPTAEEREAEKAPKEQPVTIADKDLTQPPPVGWAVPTGAEALAQLKRSLYNQTPTADQVLIIEEFRDLAFALGKFIVERIPLGRNRSIALTALEDTTMRSVKGILLD